MPFISKTLRYPFYACVRNILKIVTFVIEKMKKKKKKKKKKILQIKENYCLVDPFREAYPSLRRYTWRKKSPIKQARLDYFLVSQDLLTSVNKCSIEGSYRSDHSMIILDISFVQFKKGKPLWKHNNSLLNDKDYLRTMNNKIDEVKKQYTLPVYNIDQINNVPDDEIQFVINDQLFLETLLMDFRFNDQK